VSNFTGWQLQKAIDLSRQNGWAVFASLQPLYNLLDRVIEWELLPICQNEGLGVIPWSPLRGGWLSGKYRRGMDAPPPGSRVDEAGKRNWSESWAEYATERTWQMIDALDAVAAETGRTPAQVALNWLLQRPGVTAPIIGARSLRHLEDNLGAAGWSLSAEQMERLTQAGAVDRPYPYNF
jgi:aryl-alcohol dehydrogenase-like predicted oxidoreductase